MIQYNGITLIRDSDGTPSHISIDLHVHGVEMDTFLRSHGLSTKEQDDIARSVTATEFCNGCDDNDFVRYLPEVRRRLAEETEKIYSMRRTRPASGMKKGDFLILLLRRINRAFMPVPRKKEAAPQTFIRFCGKDTFWLRFRMQGLPHVTWCVFYTIHDQGVALVRHVIAAVEEEDM